MLMKLYYAPGACSLSPHIVAKEAGIDLTLSRVAFSADGRTTEEGEDFYVVNPRGGYVPTLRLDDESVLIEGPAIIQYLSDQAPAAGLMPERGTPAYYHALSWIAFVSSELHKGFSPLFRQDLPEQERAATIERLKGRLATLDRALEGREYILDSFSIADAYAYTILRWGPGKGIDVPALFPNLRAYMARMETREGVRTALAEEGLDPLV